MTDKTKKLADLKEKLAKYQEKLAFKMKGYRGVVHESAASELRHAEVMVLTDIVNSLKKEIFDLENSKN